MSLNILKPNRGAKKLRTRVGRGPGSKLGKTSGRGGKGQTARKSGPVKAAFEGGQMPLQRRLPKKGFNAPNSLEFQVVNLRDLEAKATGTVDPSVLFDLGLIPHATRPVKILGVGTLTKKLIVKAHAFSASAKNAIEAVSGSVEVL